MEKIYEIQKKIINSCKLCNRDPSDIKLIAVSKQQTDERVNLALDYGQRVFGENRIKEAIQRWENKKKKLTDIELHLIGPLQSNKVKDAVKNFDFIHTIDREKIAIELNKEMIRQEKTLPCFIQVNTGLESQKSGIYPNNVEEFLKFCQNTTNLKIIGLMCIPPAEDNPTLHFGFLKNLANKLKLDFLSMGMSSDYDIAIQLGATHIRIGSAFFGDR